MAKRYLRDEKTGQVVEVSKEDFDANQEKLLKARAKRLEAEPESKTQVKPSAKTSDK